MNAKYFEIKRELNVIRKKAKITVGEKWKNPSTNRLSTIKHIVHIEPCHESYQQWGSSEDVLWFTLPIAEALVKNEFKSF